MPRYKVDYNASFILDSDEPLDVTDRNDFEYVNNWLHETITDNLYGGGDDWEITELEEA